MYEVYIIQSEKDRSFYIGYSGDLNKRLSDHNLGKSRYTRSKRPWKLVYSEEYETKSEAIVREKFLKSQRNKDFYLRLIESKENE